MVMGGFGGWLAFYILLYVMIIPMLNFLLIPLLAVLIHSGKLESAIWRKFLIGNGFVNVFVSWWVVFIASDVKVKIQYNVSLYRHIPLYVIDVGMMFQALFFVVWLFFFFHKKELPNYFYKVWGWCFFFLYLLPNVMVLMVD